MFIVIGKSTPERENIKKKNMNDKELIKFKSKYRFLTLGVTVIIFLLYIIFNFSVEDVLNSGFIGD